MDFELVKTRFWSDGTYGVLSPLTGTAVEKAQEMLGVRLPAPYLDLLRVQNGGAVAEEFRIFPTPQPTSWAADHVEFPECFGIEEGHSQSITTSGYYNREWGQPDELVLLSGEGHWWVALDYREHDRDDPPVVWFDNEVDQDIRLAECFADFVEQLGSGDHL